MRLLILAAVVLSLASLVSAAYSTKIVTNHVAYAHTVSRIFAKSDDGDASGWRECVVHERPGREIGVVCEGTRTIAYQIAKRTDVGYYCEFRFTKLGTEQYSVENESCQ